MLITKYFLEDDRFLFKADYDTTTNILYNHYEDKETKEVFRTENLGDFKGKIKFSPQTIDEYIESAKGAAFPILVDGLGFVFTYDDLYARKHKISQETFNEIVQKYPRLIKRINQLGDFIRVIYQVRTIVDLETGKQTSEVIFDNTEDNWWSAESTPLISTDKVFTPEEKERYEQVLESIIYLNPIERYVWKRIRGEELLSK